MLNGQDTLVLLRLVDLPMAWTVRSLAEQLRLTRAGTYRSLKRLDDAGIFSLERRQVSFSQAEEFLLHAVRYLLPVKAGAETRGFPTAWAAPPLSDVIAAGDELPPVWPDPLGDRRGVSVEPIHPAAIANASDDPAMAERLALVDALRLPDARTRRVAAEMLSERLRAVA